MTYRARLIDLYAKTPIENIQKNTGNVYLNAFPEAESLINDKQFHDLKSEIEEGKTVIEKGLLTQNLGLNSLLESLEFLLSLSLFEFKDLERSKYEIKMTILSNIILRYFEDTWTDDQKAHFIDRVKRIKCNYLFISYTNKDAKILNFKYQTLIRDAADKYRLSRPIKQDDWEKRNLLALVISSVLTSPGRLPESRVFFDRDDLEPGDRLKTEILPLCHGSLQLLQIVTNRVFMYEHTNWTFEEYSHFENGPPIRRSIFAVADTQPPQLPEFPYPGYQSWFNSVTINTLNQQIPNDLNAFEEMANTLSRTMRNFLYTDVLS
jgi:hypothetical protein